MNPDGIFLGRPSTMEDTIFVITRTCVSVEGPAIHAALISSDIRVIRTAWHIRTVTCHILLRSFLFHCRYWRYEWFTFFYSLLLTFNHVNCFNLLALQTPPRRHLLILTLCRWHVKSTHTCSADRKHFQVVYVDVFCRHDSDDIIADCLKITTVNQ